jgi:hypothetical protein
MMFTQGDSCCFEHGRMARSHTESSLIEYQLPTQPALRQELLPFPAPFLADKNVTEIKRLRHALFRSAAYPAIVMRRMMVRSK